MNHRFRKKRQTQLPVPIRKLVTLQLGNERYAIPIEQVIRVINGFKPQGVLSTGRSLLEDNKETITLIDPSTLFLNSNDLHDCRLHCAVSDRSYLVICKLNQGERIGIPVADMPSILEIAADKLSEIPTIYQQQDLPVAVEKLIHTPEGAIVFYLNLERLFISN